MNVSEQLLDSLNQSEMFRSYERAYTETTGLPVALRSIGHWQLPFHGRPKENGWCALMAGRSQTCSACLQVQGRLSEGAMHGPKTLTCAYGLCESAVPVKLGPQTIGFLQTGQALLRKPTTASFQRAMKQAGGPREGLDPKTAREAYFQTPVVSPKKMESLTSLLSIFAEHLSMKSNQIAVQTENAELPAITKAKQFIRDNYTEELSLGKMAALVNVSVFYFCKLFRKATGTTFTEFVSRVRIEKAKNLLLNPNLRVSEIGFEVGFQSLTHFNRVFKAIVGESPKTYRSGLPSPA